ncbi:MAG: transglycosylase SLT domain-containing protein [Myxococcales bacterium]|nr:transglycosylase SLT domain-containing protein [Myxococcales bacterium]
MRRSTFQPRLNHRGFGAFTAARRPVFGPLVRALLVATLSFHGGVAFAEDEVCPPADLGQPPLDPPHAATYVLAPLVHTHPQLKRLLRAHRSKRSGSILTESTKVLQAKSSSVMGRTLARYAAVRSAERSGDQNAIKAGWRALVAEGPLVDHASIALARIAVARHDVAAAVRWLAKVRPSHPNYPRTTVWRLSLALDVGDLATAAQALTTVRTASLSRRDKAWFKLRRGDLRRRQNDTNGAAGDYVDAWHANIAPFSDAALERLFVMGRTPSRLDQVHARLRAPLLRTTRPPRKGRRARKRKRLITAVETLGAPQPGLLAYARGRILARVRASRADAVVSLQAAVEAADTPLLKAHARYFLGDLLGRLNRDAEAVVALEAIAGTTGGHEIETKARWRLHRLYRALRRPLDAERMLSSLVGPDTDSETRRAALWSLAWRRYRVGDLHGSLRLLGRLEHEVGSTCTTGRQPWRARLQYWQARSLERLGDLNGAQRRFRDIAAHWPMTWYGLLSLDRLKVSAPDVAAALLGTAPPTGPTPKLRLADIHVARTPALDEAIFLLRIGDARGARSALRSLLGNGLSRGGVQLLAALYDQAGHRRSALSVLRRFTRSAVRPGGAAVDLWRQAFPTPWPKLFERAATTAGVPQSLLYAVARHESSFVPTATSGAGAIGLVQLLPTVARRIAGLYRQRKPKPRALRRPRVSLPLGAWYLTELNQFLRDSHPLVTAAYNAGPYAVRRWIKRIGIVPTDVFIESIPYRGAAAYAMRVCTTAATYAWLYPQWQELPIIGLGRAPMVPRVLGPFMTGRRTTEVIPPLLPMDGHAPPSDVATTTVARRVAP